MALKNITNFKQQQQNMYNNKDYLKIEEFHCSPYKQRSMQINQQQHLPKIRTSSPIQSPKKAQIQLIPTHKQTTQKMSTKCNGMIKVALYNNCGLLTVHLIQARNLKTAQNDNRCDTYARVTMLPDPEHRLKCQTAIIKDTLNPIFDEKFSFEFADEDYSNRLLISIWSKSHYSFNDSLVGCFSFKIKHLMKRVNTNVCSWYYLLPTLEIGQRKHYKVKLSKNYQFKNKNQQSSNSNLAKKVSLPTINKDIIGLDKLNLVIPRGENGFGFTVTGSCPCIVGKVDPEKEAFAYGLRPGDFIVKIKDQNVSRATSESVVKMIKSCKAKLQLEIHRERATLTENRPCEPTEQCITKLYFSTQPSRVVPKSSTRTDITENSDYSGKSIDLPQYNNHLHQTTTNTATTATTATTNDSLNNSDFLFDNDEDDDLEEEEQYFSHLVSNKIETNAEQIPFVDDDECNDESFTEDKENCRAEYITNKYQQSVLVKNEARTRKPLVQSSSNEDLLCYQLNQYAHFI